MTTCIGACAYPDSRSLSAVQHMKLNARFVNDPPRQTIESVYFSNDSALADATKTRVTGACSEIFELRRYEGGSCSGSGCCSACLGAGMATSDYDDVEWSRTRLVSKRCINKGTELRAISYRVGGRKTQYCPLSHPICLTSNHWQRSQDVDVCKLAIDASSRLVWVSVGNA